MTKQELLDLLTADSRYIEVGTPVVNDSVFSDLPNTNGYKVSVLEVGNYEKTKQPIYRKRVIEFAVYDEGGGSESAFFSFVPESGPEYKLNKDITDISGSLMEQAEIYNSPVLRKRVLGGIKRVAFSKWLDGASTATDKTLAREVFADTTKWLNIFMSIVCNNSAVKSAGNDVSDTVLETNIIDARWSNVANQYIA